jgi:hypothetical protein
MSFWRYRIPSFHSVPSSGFKRSTNGAQGLPRTTAKKPRSPASGTWCHLVACHVRTRLPPRPSATVSPDFIPTRCGSKRASREPTFGQMRRASQGPASAADCITRPPAMPEKANQRPETPERTSGTETTLPILSAIPTDDLLLFGRTTLGAPLTC